MIIGCLALVVVADEFIILDEVKQDIKPNNDKSVNIKPHKYTSQLIQKI